jgi:predicted dehydrogenase
VKQFLIIGLGSIGRRHMANLAAAFPGADFTVLRRDDAPDALCERLSARIVTDFAVAMQGDYDLVVVSSPSSNHIDTLPALIARGWHLLVEKPIVASLGDCDVIDRALAAAPPAVRVSGFNFRHIPSLKQMQQTIAAGDLGRVVRASFVAGLWLPDWRPTQDYRQSYSADAARGGGVELDLVHEIDVARWFFGDLNLEFALGGRKSALALQSNDVATMVFSCDGPIVQVALDYVSRKRLRHYEIVGDKAGLCWDIDGSLDLITPGGRERLLTADGGFNVGQSYIDMVARIADAVAGRWVDPLQTLADGVASTRLSLAARDMGTRV